MGTRADFYIGKNKDAEWIGSIAWDGYRDGIDKQILNCQSPEAFRHAVELFLNERDDGIFPKDGWPWPWKNSSTTDCSYWFFGDKTWEAVADYRGGYSRDRDDVYVSCDEPEINDEQDGYDEFIAGKEVVEFPDFSGQFNGGSAGFLVITA